MNRTATLLVVVALLLAGVAVPVAASVADSTRAAGDAPASQVDTTASASNGSDEPAAPGAHFAGVVDVQEAEVESELEGRAFGIQVARSNSNASKASVVAGEVDEQTRRLETLRERKRSLTEARENGSISRARYRAEIAVLAVRTASVERQLDRTETASRGIPADLLESKGVDATAIESLRNESRSVVGPDDADDARSIAGPDTGDGLAGENASQANPDRPTTLPGQNGTPTDDTGIIPGTDGFDTPTLPGSPEQPGGGNDSTTSTTSNSSETRTDGSGDNVTDVTSTIVGGTEEGDGNDTDTDDGNSTG